MYCPNCGTKIPHKQKYCRSCGLGLEKIAQSLTEQLPTELDESFQARKDKLERLGVIALSIFGVGVLGFFLYMVGYKLMMSKGNILAILGIVGLSVVLGCGLLSVLLFAKAKDVQEAANNQRLRAANEASEATPTASLLAESHLEPVPSVTDRTTELLFVEKKSGTKGS